MTRYQIPFGEVETEHQPDTPFDVGVALALAAEDLGAKGLDPDRASTIETTVGTPWGTLAVEARSNGVLVIGVPETSIPVPRTLLTAVARALGIEQRLVEETGAQVQVVDVGREILVVPYPSGDAVREGPEQSEPARAPGVDTGEGVLYAVTQRTPYVKILARTWNATDPLAGLASAAVHLVRSGTFRPTYPRTRIVGQLVNAGEERCEITVQASKAGDTAKIEQVLVGGRVRAIES